MTSIAWGAGRWRRGRWADTPMCSRQLLGSSFSLLSAFLQLPSLTSLFLQMPQEPGVSSHCTGLTYLWSKVKFPSRESWLVFNRLTLSLQLPLQLRFWAKQEKLVFFPLGLNRRDNWVGAFSIGMQPEIPQPRRWTRSEQQGKLSGHRTPGIKGAERMSIMWIPAARGGNVFGRERGFLLCFEERS